MNISDFQADIEAWDLEHLGPKDPRIALNKVTEEIGEFAATINKDMALIESGYEAADAIIAILITLNNRGIHDIAPFLTEKLAEVKARYGDHPELPFD